MKDFKGTPGPWVKDSWNVIGTGGRRVMFGCLTLSGRTNAEVIANDNLVLAAPELLEALRQLHDYVQDYYLQAGDESMMGNDHPMRLATSAIAKALGESK